MPAATWLEIIRSIKSQQHFDRAVCEYERLAENYPQKNNRCWRYWRLGVCA